MENNKKVLKLGFDLDGIILLWLFFISKEARQVLNALKDQGQTVKVVTARGKPWTLWHARTMLRLYGLGWIEVIGVGPNGSKYEVLKDFDFFVDNRIRHLIAIGNRVKHLYFFGSQPQNGFKNLANWEEIGSTIKELEV